MVVSAAIDGGSFTQVGTLELDAGLPTLPVDLPFDLGGENLVRGKFDLENLGRGRDIQIKITESTSAGDVEVLGYVITAFIENLDMD